MSTETKTCRDCKREFIFRPDDLEFYKKMDIPLPDQCPYCRLKHLFSFWVFGKFRKTVSAMSGKTIITTLPENVPYPLYSHNEWISDKWDPLDYGMDYDPNKPFFKQFKALMDKTPHPHQTAVQITDCQWSDDVWFCKNCYLCRALMYGENLSYSYRCISCKNSLDLTYCFDTEFSYDCIYCFKCYNTRYTYNARDCIDSMFLFDCRNCSSCFMCWNLRNREYYILNKPYSKDEYFKKLKEFNFGSWNEIAKLKKQFFKIISEEAIHRQDFNIKVTNSTGNFMTECKNCYLCAFTEKSEDCAYTWRAIECKDTYDSVGVVAEKCVLAVLGDKIYGCTAITHSNNCRYSEYIRHCGDCEYCFGCVGLRKKKYCVLNKQYTKEEYQSLTERIKEKMKKDGEWGKLFPMSFTGFGYNLSLAHIHFPDTKENIERMGGLWHEFKDETNEGMDTAELPDHIEDVKDEITKQPLVCPITKQRFNIAPHELAFYKQYNIPLPRYHFDHRTLGRFDLLMQSIKPEQGTCNFCKKDIEHYFPKKLGYQKIACVECYQAEVV